MSEPSNPAYDSTLRDLEQHLLHLKAEGIRQVEIDPNALAATASPSTVHRPPSTEATAGLEAIARRVASCELCRLCKSRTRTVPGQGHPAPEIMFIGEGPGADEDAQGLAFVGRAGQLLTKIIEAIGLTRDQVFIGNIVKCRPPDNRTPLPDEMAACMPYLHEQIALLKPKLIVALGGTAMKGLFGETVGGITKLRGAWKTFQGIEVMPTYHPAYLLRNASGKRDVWNDMKAVLARLGRTPPGKSG
jgi:DNA polymerase